MFRFNKKIFFLIFIFSCVAKSESELIDQVTVRKETESYYTCSSAYDHDKFIDCLQKVKVPTTYNASDEEEHGLSEVVKECKKYARICKEFVYVYQEGQGTKLCVEAPVNSIEEKVCKIKMQTGSEDK